MSKLSLALDKIDQWIDAGKVSDARNLIVELSAIRRMPRPSRLRLAHYARRAHMPGKAVSLLHRTVCPGNGMRDGGNPDERAEYAASLTAIGAPKEAQRILEGLDAERLPMVSYFMGMAAVYQWDWDASIPPLELFSKTPSLPGDFSQWAKNFLANSLTRGPGEYVRAEGLLNQVLKATSPTLNRMAYKNALLNLLQNEVLRGASKNARKIHERIEHEELEDSDPLFTLVMEQWKALGDLLAAEPSHRSEPARRLRRIIQAYVADRRWENARGAELQMAVALQDRELLVKLGFGSPYPAFRARAFAEARKLDARSPLPAYYDRELGEKPEKRADASVIDSADGRTPLNPRAYLKPGFLLQRLFEVLSSDFYKPLQITELHEALYPGQRYLPLATADRIHQLILRLRLWFEEHRLPLGIDERYGNYSLIAHAPLRIRVWGEKAAADTTYLSPREELAIEKLRGKFASSPFSAADAAHALDAPLRSTIRRLNEGVAAGKLTRTGQARATRYHLLAR